MADPSSSPSTPATGDASANTNAAATDGSSDVVNATFVSELVSMGFTDAAAAVAVSVTGGSSVDAALSYLLSEDDDIEHKLVFVVDASLHMRTGKIAAQCAHASLGSYMTLNEKAANNAAPTVSIKSLPKWLNDGQTKVVVSVPSAESLVDIRRAAKRYGLHTHTVHDAGRTQVAAGSATVLAVGPAPAQLVNAVTGQLKLL